MRTAKEIERAIQILAIAVSDVMKGDPPDERKLENMAGVMMALSWAKKDGSHMDQTFEAMIEACNSYDAGQAHAPS